MASIDDYYKEIRLVMIAVLIFLGAMFLGLTSGFEYLGLNQVVIPSPLKWFGLVILFMAYHLHRYK